MRAAAWIGGVALVTAAAVTVIGARTQAAVLVSGWQFKAEAALRALGADDVRVSLDGRTLEVEGCVADPAQRLGVLAALGTIDGVTTIRGDLVLTPRQSLPDPDAAAAASPRETAAQDESPATPILAAVPEDRGPDRDAPCQGELDALFAGAVIRFAAFSAAVGREHEPLFDDVAEVMAKCPTAVLEIAGHSDGTGIEELNDSLSRARAEAVRQILIQLGIQPNRLLTVSYGDRVPVADDTTESGRMQNRRIELRLREAR